MRRIVISGASSGLGKAIIKGIARAGDEIICLGRTNPELNFPYVFIECDYTDPENVVHELKARNICSCDLLINCAGYMPLANSFLSFTLQQELDVLNVNLMSHYLVMKHFIQGSFNDYAKLEIINIASSCGVKPDCDTPLYAASKSGIISLSQGLSTLNPNLVRINCISPGFFNTNLVPGEAPQELLDELVPMKREAHPEEILPVVKMILDSPFMTGSNIIIDGGQVRK